MADRRTIWQSLLLAFLSTVGVATSVGRAQQVEISSPLDGYMRAGRSAAVHVSAQGLTATRLSLSGEGVIAVRVPATAGRIEATVPLLVQGQPPTQLRWSAGDRANIPLPLGLRMLGSHERLVVASPGLADANALAAELFPGKQLVQVKFETDRSRLLWPPQAYEAADAILLDLASAARVDESQLRVLLAAGTTVAVRSTVRPAGQWPWRKQGAWWVLEYKPAGPPGGVNVEAYAPTFTWDRSWPQNDRYRLLLATSVGGLLLLMAVLWRGRAGLVAALVVCVSGFAGALLYTVSLRPAVTAAGDVIVWDGHLTQRDRWTYTSAFKESRHEVEAADQTRPVLGSRRQLDSLSLSLSCDAFGWPRQYEFVLGAKQTIAFVSRSVLPTPPPAGDGKTSVPMDLFADKQYPGVLSDRVETPPEDVTGEWWGTVVMRR